MGLDFDVNLRMSQAQATAVSAACWMYVRIGTGHLEEILEYMRHGLITARREADQERASVESAEFMAIRRQILEIKRLLGHRGDVLSGHDLSHPHIHESVLEVFEVRKAIHPSFSDPQATEVSLDIPGDRAAAVSAACDLYTRICMGQLEEIVDLMRMGVIPAARKESEERGSVSYQTLQDIIGHVMSIKQFLGHHPHSSLGIGHPHVDLSAKRTWEVRKALDKAFAIHRDPNPAYPGVEYNGNFVRYTDDPVPVVTVQERTADPAP